MTSPAEHEQRERIRTIIHSRADEACALVAQRISDLIRENAGHGRPTVLGLATGSTPVRLYRELIRLHRSEGLSFRTVISFNLDEYYGLPRTHPESYWRFMQDQLFAHIDILPENVHLPDGMVPRADVFAWCRNYEDQIRAAGGIDLQVLGIGRTGHIGFNEPGSGRESRTRLVTLDRLTRRDAARDFLGEANVPRHAITMGVGTILEAREIVLLAWGSAKARVLADAVEQTPSDTLPASLLQVHPVTTFHVDQAAASELTRMRHPWLVGPVKWESGSVRRAVVWLSQQVKKPVLKLLDEDYGEHGLADLLTEQGPAYELNIRIFNELQHTITGWPGGKLNADDSHRPERAHPHPKRIIVLSPEPSDEVIGMGGTLRRLVDQGHAVTVAYQTSGNLGVPDDEATMAAELTLALERVYGSGDSGGGHFARTISRQLAEKDEFDGDTPEIRQLKGILRRGEAQASLRAGGVKPAEVKFLDLPFYERGRYRQFQLSDADVAPLVAELRAKEPHQIFATGHTAEPSSVAALCFEALRRALTLTAADSWRSHCRLWLYRAPGHAWDLGDIDMAVPMSPAELHQNIQAIYQHRSQHNQSPATNASQQEVWQQAESHNRAMARQYDTLGLAEYEAIEPFERFESQ